MKRLQTLAVIRRLRAGKHELREQRIAMSNPEKVQQVVELQKATLPMIRRRRTLEPWEGIWPIRPR